MLQAIRDRITGWIAWAIVGLIAVTFALWGIDYYLRDSADFYAAKVNDQEIQEPELQWAMQQQRLRMRQLLGANYDPSAIDETELRKGVLDNLVRERVLISAAQEAGFAIGDQLLAARIQAIPDLQENGSFSMTRYENVLRQQGMTPVGFEAKLRSEMLVNQLISGLAATSAVGDDELERLYAMQAQRRDVDFLVVSAAEIAENLTLSAEEVQAYFEQHRESFREPEKVRLEYLSLKRDDLAEEIAVDEAEVLSYYERNQPRFGTTERRRASHILIELDADADEAAVEEARAKAEQALKRVRDGEEFAVVAAELSDDPGSKEQGGDLGFFGKGMMVPEFEDAVFALEEGEVSDLVRTPFGFHIIRLTAIEAGEVKPLEAVRDEILAELREGQLEDLFYDRSEILANASYENPDTLVVAAEALGLEVETTDWLNAGEGPGIGRFAAVRAAAFSEDVLDGGNNSEPLEVEPGHLIVVRVLEHEEARLRALGEVEEEVRAALRRERSRDMARQRGEALMERWRAGATAEALAEEAKAVRHEAPGMIDRTAADLPAGVLTEAFRLPRPEEEGAALGGTELANGDYAIVRVRSVEPGDPAKLTDAERRQARENLARLYGASEVDAMVRMLRDRAEVEIPNAQ
jgi:peptidyl-prolyl cis-trans isomerase D